MLETSRIWWGVLGVLAGGCVAPPPADPERPAPAPTAAVAPMASPAEQAKVSEEARALLAQAETDVQRARAKRALWLNAWEDLLAARQAAAAGNYAATIRHARRASEFAQLGLEQLAYPAVR